MVVYRHFQQYFSYIVAVSFIDEGNWRKPPTSQTLSHKLYWVHLAGVVFKLTTLVVIGTDCIGSFKSNYPTIMTTTAPPFYYKNNWRPHSDWGEQVLTQFHINEMGYLTKCEKLTDWVCVCVMCLSGATCLPADLLHWTYTKQIQLSML